MTNSLVLSLIILPSFSDFSIKEEIYDRLWNLIYSLLG